jgi:fatty-acyl-CoA synthase
MGYMSGGYIFIVGRAKDMIIINGRNHWPQDIEWAVEQLPGFKSGDIAAFAITGPSGEETPAVLVHCRVSERARPPATTSASARITGISPVVASRRTCRELGKSARNLRRHTISPVVELIPPRSPSSVGRASVSKTEARGQVPLPLAHQGAQPLP